MAKTKAPLLGFKATGTIGDSLTFSNWRGVGYARQHVIPTNPNTAAQQSVRTVFKWINDLYRLLDVTVQDVWRDAARGKPATDRNLVLKYNVPALSGGTTITNIILSPGTRNAPAADTVTASAGTNPGELNASATLPSLPTGWTVNGVLFTAIRQQDPHSDLVGAPVTVFKAQSPYSVTFSSLSAGQQYVVSAVPVYTDPRLRTAYGPGKNAVAAAGS